MRLIYVVVPERNREAVLDHLDEEGIDHRVLEEYGDSDAALVQFPLPTSAVADVLEDLNEAGLEDEYTIVSSAETVETSNFEELEDRYTEEEEKDIAPAELRTRALEMGQRTVIYYTMTLLSAMVAAAGLLLDAPAVVVGSMVIAPQVGSALKSSVGTVFGDREMIVDGLRSQVLGLSLAVASAAAFGLGIRWLGVGPPELPSLAFEQLSLRVSPGVLSVAVAIGAGFAAAFSLATAVPTSLVGVMIAAALIPAAAAVGIGVAWGTATIAVGAAVLLVVNATVINLTGIAGLWGLGYRPGADSRRDTNQPRTAGSLRPTIASLLVLSLVFAGAGYVTVQHVAFERTATDAVEEVLSGADYDRLSLVTVETKFGLQTVVDVPSSVTVIVRRPADAEYPQLASAIREEVRSRVATPVDVQVEFRDTAIATGDGAAVVRPPVPAA